MLPDERSPAKSIVPWYRVGHGGVLAGSPLRRPTVTRRDWVRPSAFSGRQAGRGNVRFPAPVRYGPATGPWPPSGILNATRGRSEPECGGDDDAERVVAPHPGRSRLGGPRQAAEARAVSLGPPRLRQRVLSGGARPGPGVFPRRIPTVLGSRAPGPVRRSDPDVGLRGPLSGGARLRVGGGDPRAGRHHDPSAGGTGCRGDRARRPNRLSRRDRRARSARARGNGARRRLPRSPSRATRAQAAAGVRRVDDRLSRFGVRPDIRDAGRRGPSAFVAPRGGADVLRRPGDHRGSESVHAPRTVPPSLWVPRVGSSSRSVPWSTTSSVTR